MNYEYFEDTNFFVELVKHVKFNIIRILQLSWQQRGNKKKTILESLACEPWCKFVLKTESYKLGKLGKEGVRSEVGYWEAPPTSKNACHFLLLIMCVHVC